MPVVLALSVLMMINGTWNLEEVIVEHIIADLCIYIFGIQALMHVRELITTSVVAHWVACDRVIWWGLLVLVASCVLRADMRLFKCLTDARLVLACGELARWRHLLVVEHTVACRDLILALIVRLG